MAGFGFEMPCLVHLGLSRLLIDLVHLVGVAVVGSDQRHAAQFVNDFEDARELDIQRFHGAPGRQQGAGVSHHVTVGEIDAIILVRAALQLGNQAVSYFGTLHPRALLKGHHVGRDFHIGLQFLGELAGLVAVPEVGHVSELLRFGDSELTHAGSDQILAHGVGDLRRIYQVAVRDMQVAVILQHSGVQHVRYAHAVELVKLSGRRVECLGDFNGAVAAEIEKDHAVAVLHGADRLAVLCDDEGGQILVDDVQLVPVCFDRLCGGGELPSLAQHVGAPALGDHCPVGFVAVHGDAHPSAAGGDADIEIGAAQLRHEGFKGIDILQRGGLADITSVDQDMDAHAADALLLGLHDHCLEVVDVGVDIAVRKKPQEMQGGVPILYVGD